MRLFVGIALPDGVRAALSADRPAEPGVRWTAPESLHVTVRFLGSVADETIPKVTAALDRIAAAHPPFALRVSGGGSFPEHRPPKILWAGLQGDVDRLRALVADTETAVVGLGFEGGDRAYHPHVTLARVKEGRARAALEAVLRLGDAGSVAVDSLVLFESRLGPGGARYVALATAQLHGRAALPTGG